MNYFKTTLAGFGLALGLLALPLSVGAETNAALTSQYAQHRFFFSEQEVWRTQDEATATYAMLEVTDLERIAGRTNLDLATIQFLEDNLWEYDFRAEFEGEPDDAGIGVDAIDLDMFSDEIPWQDRVEPYAGFADVETSNVYPEPLPPALIP